MLPAVLSTPHGPKRKKLCRGTTDEWYRLRGNALAEVAIDFLEARGIGYQQAA
jgi:hypothetical protein